MRSIKRAWLVMMCLPTLLNARGKTPAWVEGADPRFPESGFVTGVGMGSDLEGARANARAEIARTFQARVQQVVRDVQSESSQGKGLKRTPAQSSQRTETDTQVLTDALLEGVAIRETHFDKKSKKYFALAVLDKTAYRRSLAPRLTDLEESISLHRQGAANAHGLERLQHLSQALADARERESLMARRRAVDPTGMADVGNPTAELAEAVRLALRGVRLRVVTEAEDQAHLGPAVAAAVGEMGLALVTDQKSPVDYILTCQLTTEPFDRGNERWIFYQWTGAVHLSDAKGNILQSAAPSGQESQLTDSAALQRALTVGSLAVADAAREVIQKAFFGN